MWINVIYSGKFFLRLPQRHGFVQINHWRRMMSWNSVNFGSSNVLVPSDPICYSVVFAIFTHSIHYSYVIMSPMASQITGVSMVCSIVCSGADKKKTSKLRVTGLREGSSPVTDEFPEQTACDEGNVSIWWRCHGGGQCYVVITTCVGKLFHMEASHWQFFRHKSNSMEIFIRLHLMFDDVIVAKWCKYYDIEVPINMQFFVIWFSGKATQFLLNLNHVW